MDQRQNKVYNCFLEEGFLPISRDAYPLFKEYDKGGILLHETTATVSIIWAFAYNALYKIIQRHLCSVWFYQNGAVYIIVQRPASADPAESSGCSLRTLIDALYKLSSRVGLPSLQIWAVEERFKEEYQTIGGYVITNEYNDDWSEYAYLRADILELSGERNFYKRKRLKKYLDAPNVSLRPMTVENVRICLEVEEEWCRRQDCEYCGSFTGCAKKSLELMFDVFDDTVYNGLLGYIDNIPVGYAIWEKVDDTIAFVYFAKANVPGFNVYLYYMMSKEYLFGVKYINNGHDMGKPGLRVFKQHLSVHELWRKYLFTFFKREHAA
jgi:hypothetical protein